MYEYGATAGRKLSTGVVRPDVIEDMSFAEDWIRYLAGNLRAREAYYGEQQLDPQLKRHRLRRLEQAEAKGVSLRKTG